MKWRRCARHYGVSLEHARKVAHISSLLFTALQPLHELPPAVGKLLEASAYLHDVGHFVSSVGHHKHSYYVVSNSDMPGFTARERLLIAVLCRYHRKSMPAPMHNAYQSLTPEEKRMVTLSIPLLRLADNLDRSHDQRIQVWSVACGTARYCCRFTPKETSIWSSGAPNAPLRFFARFTTGPSR